MSTQPQPEERPEHQPEAMFTPERKSTHPIAVGAPTLSAAAGDGVAMAEDEKAQIMAQLQMLGYME